jgi:hypothetical protein
VTQAIINFNYDVSRHVTTPSAFNAAYSRRPKLYEGWNFNNGNTAVETPGNGTK